jgi:hypothetical protein
MGKKAIVRIKVTSVTLKADSSVKKYSRDAAGMQELWTELKKAKLWGAQAKLDKKGTSIDRIIGLGYPDVGGHPGHVHGKDWKYNIERGNGSVDRLVVEDWKAKVKKEDYDAKKGVITAEVEVTVSGRALEDTH